MPRKAKSYSVQLQNAIEDFKTLVIYFDVTRPQYEKAYKDGSGKFSPQKFFSQKKWLGEWNAKSQEWKNKYCSLYNKYAIPFNYTLGIPGELVKKIVGHYTVNGKTTRFPVKDVVSHLVSTGWLKKVLGNGSKFEPNGDSWKPKGHRLKKYLINDGDWYAYMCDPKYGKLESFPNASDNAKKIISKWHESDVMEPWWRKSYLGPFFRGEIDINTFYKVSIKKFKIPKETLDELIERVKHGQERQTRKGEQEQKDADAPSTQVANGDCLDREGESRNGNPDEASSRLQEATN